MASSSSANANANGGFEIYFDGVAAAASSPAKKGRGVQAAVISRCQVQGCNLDLSDAKSYYSRHKVCAKHSKSPIVVVSGIHQRFCQQCSREYYQQRKKDP